MKVFKNVWFTIFARQEGISDVDLCQAVERAQRGLIDADLGGGVIKQRVPRRNQGRSGGFRTIIFFRVEERAVFAFGFAKNVSDNISTADLKTLKQTAQLTLALSDEEIETAVKDGDLIEVICNATKQDLQERNSSGDA